MVTFRHSTRLRYKVQTRGQMEIFAILFEFPWTLDVTLTKHAGASVLSPVPTRPARRKFEGLSARERAYGQPCEPWTRSEFRVAYASIYVPVHYVKQMTELTRARVHRHLVILSVRPRWIRREQTCADLARARLIHAHASQCKTWRAVCSTSRSQVKRASVPAFLKRNGEGLSI